MKFSLKKDIFNYKDIICFYFFNNGNTFFIINVYSNKHQSTLKYLKNTKANVLAIIGDFNISIKTKEGKLNFFLFSFQFSFLLLYF